MNRTVICCLIIVLGCFCLTGCVNAKKMVVDQTSFGITHPVTIALKVTGGSPGAVFYASGTIPLKKYRSAVKMSLEKSNLFEGLVEENVADCLLNVNLSWAVAESSGFYSHAVVNSEWELVKRISGENFWSTSVVGNNGSANINTSLEKAAKSNIESALSQISELDLKNTEY